MISVAESDFEAEFVEEMRVLFSEEGALSKSRDFEFRPQQQEMAVRVARALEEAAPLVIEAGTGVGKSLAYLAPAVQFAKATGRKALVSTHTIALQEQLIGKDIPILQRLLDVPMKAVLLKGRRNFVCPGRLKRALDQSDDLFSGPEHTELEALREWCETTKDGSLSDLDFTPRPAVWSQACSEAHLCTPKTCAPGTGCFYQDLRKRVGEADVVVLNHTLFFTLMASLDDFTSEGRGFLFPNDFVIFDEAHTLEGVAARTLGLNLSEYGLKFDVQRLYNPRTKKGLLHVLRDAESVRLATGLLEDIGEFFLDCERACRFGDYGREFRVREPEFVKNSLAEGLIALQKRVVPLAESVENEATKQELQDLGRKVGEARLALEVFLEQGFEDHVYWVEKSGWEGKSLALRAAPVNVSEVLRKMLFERRETCVMTSATLGTGDDDLRYFRRRVGADEVEGVRIGSPFDYASQMKIYIVKSMPAPNEGGYGEALRKWIRHFVQESQGRAFVLFTSYRAMRDAASGMESFFAEKGWTLLVQGDGRPRGQLLEEFKEDTHSVLFGTDSFWTGVDVPGEALSNVIVTRLPFAVPDHPLVASRLEAIAEEGGDAFMEYSLPEAILKLRQGVGRLIRSHRDEGSVVILDNRILTKRYGKSFLNALPNAPVEIVD